MLHIPPTNLLLLAAKQEPYKKDYLLMKILEEFLEKGQENGPESRRKKNPNNKTERVTGLSQRTRQEMWNQMTALTFQTRGRKAEALVVEHAVHGVICSGS